MNQPEVTMILNETREVQTTRDVAKMAREVHSHLETSHALGYRKFGITLQAEEPGQPKQPYEAPAVTGSYDHVEMLTDLRRVLAVMNLREKALQAEGMHVPISITNLIERLEKYAI